jgi:hypothetical protein
MCRGNTLTILTEAAASLCCFLRADAAVVREEEVCVEKRSGFVVQACAEDSERRRGLSGLS